MMLIDLRSVSAKDVEKRQRLERIRIALNKKTVRQLRDFARERHIALGGESSKQGIITEIMGQYGHQWELKEGEKIG